MRELILSNSEKFSASQPLLPAYDFSATIVTTYSTYRLAAVVSLKCLAIENMPPHFSAHDCYGQTAGWIRIPLGMEVCLGSGDIVLYGDPYLPTERDTADHHFSATALARIPADPHFTHNPYCRIGSAQRAALVYLLCVEVRQATNYKVCI